MMQELQLPAEHKTPYNLLRPQLLKLIYNKPFSFIINYQNDGTILVPLIEQSTHTISAPVYPSGMVERLGGIKTSDIGISGATNGINLLATWLTPNGPLNKLVSNEQLYG